MTITVHSQYGKYVATCDASSIQGTGRSKREAIGDLIIRLNQYVIRDYAYASYDKDENISA